MKKRRKKYALTLLEVMIVIVLIGIIGSVIGYNMKDSLDEGKAFRTRYAMQQIQDILLLEAAKGTPLKTVVAEKEKYLAASGLVKNVQKMLVDGWGQPFKVKSVHETITVSSTGLDSYKLKKSKKTGVPVTPEPTEETDDKAQS